MSMFPINNAGQSTNQFFPLMEELTPDCPVIEESSVVTAQNYWLNRGKSLCASNGNEFTLYINAAAKRILSTLSMMSSLGYSAERIDGEAKRAIAALNVSSEKFFIDCKSYQQQKCNVNQKLDLFNAKIQEKEKSLSFEAFSPFTPHGDSHEHSNEYSPFTDWSIGKSTHFLEHSKGKRIGVSCELVCQALTAKDLPDNNNPIRDRIFSGAAHVGIGEAIQHYLPKRLRAYTVLAGLNLLKNVAQKMEVSLDNLSHKQEVEYWWDRQWLLTGEGTSFAVAQAQAHGLLKLAQVPGHVLHAIHHKITCIAAKIGDHLGLTDENIAYAARRSLEFIADNSPELMEEKVWEKAALDK